MLHYFYFLKFQYYSQKNKIVACVGEKSVLYLERLDFMT